MFKNATLYEINAVGLIPSELETAMAEFAFLPCHPTQELSVGWVPPRGEDNGALVETANLNQHMFLQLAIETRSVPAEAIQRSVAEAIKSIEQETGRKPGKKERRQIKEDAPLALLPQAFPKRVNVGVWIDTNRRRLVIDTATAARADIVVTALVKLGLTLNPVSPNVAPPSTRMMQWLITRGYDMPPGMDLGRACELRACDESGAIVRYTDHSLDIEEIRGHLRAGMRPTRLQLYYSEPGTSSYVDVVLTDTLTLLRIDIDVAIEVGDGEDHFDAASAIFVLSMRPLLDTLLGALIQ